MPKKEVILSLFIASPGDVHLERTAIVNAVSELNLTWSQAFGIRIDVLRWETHTHPDFDSDPQAVINRQIGDEYDIFMGILWTKFGSPTPRAESGTIEEFERVLKRWEKDPKSVSIKIYFKDEALSPSAIDGNQLIKINQFKERVSKIGGLYHKFTTTYEFEKMIRIHLGFQIQEWRKRLENSTSFRPAQGKKIEPKTKEFKGKKKEEFEDEGFLDLVEKGTEGFKDVADVSNRLTEASQIFTEDMEKTTEELKMMNKSSSELNLKQGKRIIKQAAKNMNEYAKKIELEIPNFRNAYSVALDSYGKATTILKDFGSVDMQSIKDSISTVKSIRESLIGSKRAVQSVQDAISSHPRISTEYNRAKRKVIEMLNNLVKEMSVGINLAGEVEGIMRNVLKEI